MGQTSRGVGVPHAPVSGRYLAGRHAGRLAGMPPERADRYGAGGYLGVVDGDDRLDYQHAGMIVDAEHAAPSSRRRSAQSARRRPGNRAPRCISACRLHRVPESTMEIPICGCSGSASSCTRSNHVRVLSAASERDGGTVGRGHPMPAGCAICVFSAMSLWGSISGLAPSGIWSTSRGRVRCRHASLWPCAGRHLQSAAECVHCVSGVRGGTSAVMVTTRSPGGPGGPGG